VPDGIVSGFRTSSRPTHNGVDLGASRYDQIHAAAAGVVIVSKCDVGNCDHDGSPSTPGCGWFVDILHADQIITRYCHMVRRPFVRVGDRITAGQVIGQVGTSGHSSGPHLHFETHLDGDRSGRGAVNPVSFMAARGAPLVVRGMSEADFTAWASEWRSAPSPIVPVPALSVPSSALRGERVIIGLPGHGWRMDLRADSLVSRGSHSLVPVMPEGRVVPIGRGSVGGLRVTGASRAGFGWRHYAATYQHMGQDTQGSHLRL